MHKKAWIPFLAHVGLYILSAEKEDKVQCDMLICKRRKK